MQVVFFCVLKFALIFIWWSVETLLLCVDSIIVFCYYMCFQKIKFQKTGSNSLTRAIVKEKVYISYQTTFLSYLISRFFFELRCIYWFSWQLCCLLLRVLLLVNWYNLSSRFLSLKNSSDYKETRNQKKKKVFLRNDTWIHMTEG